MKKYLLLIFIFAFFAVVSSTFGEPYTSVPAPYQSCPKTSSAMSGSNGQPFVIRMMDNADTGGVYQLGYTYNVNDAAVLVGQDGNVVPPSQNVEIPQGKYTLKTITSGEYYNCGGYYDSPPITFGDEPVYYQNSQLFMTESGVLNSVYNRSGEWGSFGLDNRTIPFNDSIYCTPRLNVTDNGVG